MEPSPIDTPTTDFLSSLSNYDNDLQMTLESPSTSDLVENTNLTSDHVYSPIIQSVDKPSSSLPKVLTFSEDLLHASVGFRRIDFMKQHLSDLYQHTVRLDSLPVDAVLDEGNFTTLCKKNRNTVPVKCPP